VSPAAPDGRVMLANQSKTVAPTPVEAIAKLMALDWRFELKWDGVRCLAHKAGGGITLINRNGKDITERYPDLIDTFAAIPYEQFQLDGEIIALGANGHPDFELLAKRDRIGSAAKARLVAAKLPVYYAAFDLRAIDGHDYRSSPWLVRREVLDEVAASVTDSPRLRPSPVSQAGDVMWQFVLDQQLEGLVAKNPLSGYHAGRSPDWVKLRRTKSVSCAVSGYEEGSGWAEGLVGALNLTMLNEQGRPVSVGKVGTGFTKQHRTELLAYFREDGTVARPVVVEVEYQELSNDGKLRFPSFRGVRSDVAPPDCSTEQLA
jgi:bifunctional non-homologous end joining protein LigD